MDVRLSLRVLAIGVAAATLGALGLAAPAHGASDTTWNRLAQCESGGNWRINTGNGYYGGVQFSLGSWRAVNGHRYAAYPHRATRAQQVAAAERLLRIQGWGAWPACSRKLGLTAAHAKGTPQSIKRSSKVSRNASRTSVRPKTVIRRNGSVNVRAGERAVVTFRLRVLHGGKPLANKQVRVCKKARPDGKVRCGKRARTAKNGVVRVVLPSPQRSKVVWVKFSGGPKYKASTSHKRVVKVRR